MFKKITNIVSWILLIALFVGCGYSIFTVYKAREAGQEAFVLGYRPVYVMTGSMEPYMREKSLIMTKQVSSMDDIEVGDVITYHLELDGKMLRITHRIINIDDEGNIMTQGDNNQVADAYSITIDNVDAKVVFVWNYAATIINYWNSGIAGKAMIIFGILFILLFIHFIETLLQELFSKKKEEAAPVVNVYINQENPSNNEVEVKEINAESPEIEDNTDENEDK